MQALDGHRLENLAFKKKKKKKKGGGKVIAYLEISAFLPGLLLYNSTLKRERGGKKRRQSKKKKRRRRRRRRRKREKEQEASVCFQLPTVSAGNLHLKSLTFSQRREILFKTLAPPRPVISRADRRMRRGGRGLFYCNVCRQ